MGASTHVSTHYLSKGADARHQTVKELAIPLDGALDSAIVFRVFFKFRVALLYPQSAALLSLSTAVRQEALSMLRFPLASISLRSKQECFVEATAPRSTSISHRGGLTLNRLRRFGTNQVRGLGFVPLPVGAAFLSPALHSITPRVGCAHNKH